jgi:predicted nucleic acid-binding protein
MIVFLDSWPVSLITHPQRSESAHDCRRWADRLLARRIRVCISEIIDYEVRREAVRRGSTRGLARLDHLPQYLEYVAITTPHMRRAALLWAEARNRGRPTAAPAALDADVILAAQAQMIAEVAGDTVIVATENARHLAQFVDARRWQEIDG